MVHSFNQFHPAGHGTFFSGLLRQTGSDLDRQFLWIYDCGSKRYKGLPDMIDYVADMSGKDTIDMLCVSHFDDDHVNGMKALLGKFTVEVLVLPYLPFNRRLQVAFETKTSEVLLFALDPIGYLDRNGLLEKVRRVVLIRGSNDPAPKSKDPENLPSEESSNEVPKVFPAGEPAAAADYPVIVDRESGGKNLILEVISASSVLQFMAQWEFVFFNRPLLAGAPISGHSVANVQADVIAIVNSTVFADPVKLFDALQACYDMHFGSDSTGRNDISLCLLSRPLGHSRLFESCSLFDTPEYPIDVAFTSIPVDCKGAKAALLLTGDVSIDASTLDEMITHYGVSRWQNIRVMQIPHHASEFSWEAGNAKRCAHHYSVLCVPTVDKGGHHPHRVVLEDIKKTNVLRADYSQSVVYAFHAIDSIP